MKGFASRAVRLLALFCQYSRDPAASADFLVSMSVHCISDASLEEVFSFVEPQWLLLGRVCHRFRVVGHLYQRDMPQFVVHFYLPFEQLHRLRDWDLLEMLPRWPSIVYLDLRGCTSITDASLDGVAQNCPHLQDMWLHNCSSITAPALRNLVTRCSGLVSLGLPNCGVTDVALAAFATFCPHLQYLDIENSFDVTGSAIARLAQNASHLRYLNIACGTTGYGIPPRVWDDSVTDSTVVAVAHNCPRLECLNLRGRCFITAAAVWQILQWCFEFIEIELEDDEASEELLEKSGFVANAFNQTCWRRTFVGKRGSAGWTFH